ncbi:myosin class 2 heavy chain [Grosmannia clavigera kw1407]|uniref:Myosin class 2 heavy chain n=1 Tax=Grosmannia clavigera (strain kw1407 / UAMH 11150) TaxID=655863 RepID=F0XJZ4_GROCL|nr:myosin class 2 heavy chain [Grosmannia clavigera kw1407]EFX02000.1 myosin class 2 heavy chain [Grosmannia clavigera kw1407]
MRSSCRSLTTSSPRPESQLPPRASAQADGTYPRLHTPSSPRSPALSTASTADAGPSPPLPALPIPQLPERILALLRTRAASFERVEDDGEDDEYNDGYSYGYNDDDDDDDDDEGRFVTTSWGSPYPRSETSQLQQSSLGSETSEDSPIHHLELNTPFLRPAPFISIQAQNDEQDGTLQDLQHTPLSPLHLGNAPSLVSAAILANRARRPARGITEDWIRQHTTGDIGSEARLWLSDSSEGDSENSSLSGSVIRDPRPWSGEDEYALRTPRAVPAKRSVSGSSQATALFQHGQAVPSHRHQLRSRISSTETLKGTDARYLQRPSTARRNSGNSSDTMTILASREAENVTVDASVVAATTDADSDAAQATPAQSEPLPIATPAAVPTMESSNGDQGNGYGPEPEAIPNKPPPAPAARPAKETKERATIRRAKKKVPWKGKSIVVLLPIDEDRGRPGHAPVPLTQAAVDHMRQSWKDLGYDIDGFDLHDSDLAAGEVASSVGQTMSRPSWPSESDVAQERSSRKYPILLPDLNAWKNYVAELNEAKLRALGVSFGDDEPPMPPPSSSMSAGIGASISRQSSANMYPPLPFSPPLPTSSAASSRGASGFNFPTNFIPGHSPSMSSVASPVPFGMGSKYNSRQSISIPAGAYQHQQQNTPGGFSPQMFLQHNLARGGSPSLAALMSPGSPFSADGFAGTPLHQRHQSLQFPLLQHHLQPSARASPRLQNLAEVDERPVSESPTKMSELPSARGTTAAVAAAAASAAFIQHNASSSLQKEIDDAEYHLEEQFRSQFEHDRAYSPHGERQFTEDLNGDGADNSVAPGHAQDLSVQFASPPPIQRFRDDAENGPPLHHPRPHSRGHSLANAYYADPEDATFAQSTALVPVQKATQDVAQAQADDSYEIETNPSNLGSPTQAQTSEYGSGLQQPHQHTFSTTSNPWRDSGSFSVKPDGAKRPGHASKGSLSRFNVEAPEFKFNPASASTFKSSFGSQFSFGTGASETFQPSVFHAGSVPNVPLSATSSQFSFPMSTTAVAPVPASVPTKISAGTSTFSPGQSEFSFSAAGPKFRPDAPAFTPLHSFSNSLTSPVQSGPESVAGGNATSSIFGNIDLNMPDVGASTKRSKAVPIIRPTSHHSSGAGEKEPETQYDQEGRVTDDTRIKRARATPKADDDDEVLFAEPTNGGQTTDAQEASATASSEVDEAEAANDDASNLAAEEATLSSTAASETTDTKMAATTSPSEVSSVQASNPWAAFEFNTEADMAAFNSARPIGETRFRHEKSLSATAKPFTPRESLGSELEAQRRPADATEQADDESLASSLQQPPPPPPATEKPKGLSASRYAVSPPPPTPPPKMHVLSDSRSMASSPPPVPRKDDNYLEGEFASVRRSMAMVPSAAGPVHVLATGQREPTFEEIDDIMCHLSSLDPAQGVNRATGVPSWQQLPMSGAEATRRSSLSPELEVEQAPSVVASFDTGGRAVRHLTGGGSLPVSEWERDFTDEEHDKLESRVNFFDGRVNDVMGGLLSARLGPLEETLEQIQHAVTSMLGRNGLSQRSRRSMSGTIRDSDADDEDEEMPLPVSRGSLSPRKDRRLEQMRNMFLDALSSHQQHERVQSMSVASLAAPAEEVLDASVTTILKSLSDMKEQIGQSLRVDFRGDDLRQIVEEAVERQLQTTAEAVPARRQEAEEGGSAAEMLEARVMELELRLQAERANLESELLLRRTAEDKTAEMGRKLELAETKIEVEIMNRSAYDQRVADLEDRLRHQEEKTEAEMDVRRSAEGRLSEVQGQLRISTEERTRLREELEERGQQLKAAEETTGTTLMRLAVLEAAQAREETAHSDLQNRANTTEAELREKMQEARHWRAEAERAMDVSQRQGEDLLETSTELRHVKRVVDTMGTQLGENERLREAWRNKFVALQEEMSRAAREVAEESARHIKREQTLLARQEVLEAKLQAEARTRERLESELERLESGERQAMRAVAECKRLEGRLNELQMANEDLQQQVRRHQAESGEARESAAREVQRTRESLQAEVETANYEVNAVRRELEDQVAQARGQVDQVRLDADTARARLEMLLEEAEATKRTVVEEETRRHESAVEDLQARYERQVQNATEDAQRTEQNLLERLSISTSKTELLQDRVAHLEEKLEVAQEAAQAAARIAKGAKGMLAVARADTTNATDADADADADAGADAGAKADLHQTQTLPEKISPQALRESIMVLQEQLQQREQRIETLEQQLAQTDPDSAAKMAKRDEEIVWLRELLAVRHADLQDIVTALGREDHDPERVRDAAIRLQANLQMEEQERERAVNGGSAISLPTLAASIRDAATPRVAQAVLPLAAAWGNWRRGAGAGGNGNGNAVSAFSAISSVLTSSPMSSASSSPTSRPSARGASRTTRSFARPAATPSRVAVNINDANNSSNSSNGAHSDSSTTTSTFLSGLLTPPTSGARQAPTTRQQLQQLQQSHKSHDQPTAFASTGRRYPAEQPASRRPTSRSDSKQLAAVRHQDVSPSPPSQSQSQSQSPVGFRHASRSRPVTPPMTHAAVYDSDAQAEDFDDAAFFDD